MAKYEQAAPKILELLEQGLTNKQAAQRVGIDEATFYRWCDEKSNFYKSVQRAREIGEKRSIAKVEASLLELALGFEYEEVKTEYESQLNPATGKYEPTIKKQVRTKKRVVPNSEAIKFFLTNKAPEEWKNRIEQNNTGDLVTDLRIQHVSKNPDDDVFPSSESEVEV